MGNTLQPGDGYFLTNMGSASVLTMDNQVQLYPDIPLTVQRAAGDRKVYIVPGTVNQLIPKVSSTYIDALPRPTISVTANGYIILEVSRVSGQPFPNNPLIYYSASIPSNTSSNGYFALASVTVTGSAAIGYGLVINNYRSPYIGAVSVGRQKFGTSATYYWWA